MSGHAPSMTVFEKIYARKWRFVAVFTLIYFLSLSTLSLVGLAPWSNSVSDTTDRPIVTGGNNIAVEEGEAPIGIEIPKVGIKATVSNPRSADVATLDAALVSGAVRYPGSALPGEEGNVLLFGHSSNLPIVHNQAYKAFNDIQNLEKGDPIFIVGKDHVYIYAVESVREANTASDAIALDVEGAKLTLATCNNFGTKEDRFIVTATLMQINERQAAE